MACVNMFRGWAPFLMTIYNKFTLRLQIACEEYTSIVLQAAVGQVPPPVLLMV